MQWFLNLKKTTFYLQKNIKNLKYFKWDVLLFHEWYELILNLMAATRLK